MLTLDAYSSHFVHPNRLVGRHFYIDFRSVKVENTYTLYDTRYYVCRWTDTSEVWTAPADEIFPFFDDEGNAIKEFSHVGTLEDTLKDYY